MDTALLARVSLVTLTLALAACGGGGSSPALAPPGPPVSPPPPAPAPGSPTLQARINAATATANTNADCAQSALGDFYWEVGDQNGTQVSGTVPTSNSSVTANTMLSIASASKWLYASYVVQQRRGVNPTDIPYLNFTSGYSQFGSGPSGEIVTGICGQNESIQQCIANNNSAQDPSTIGHFFYDSGHMEVHANTVMGLGALDDDTASATILQGVDFGQGSPSATTYRYTNPTMSGGVETTAQYYAIFLRRILNGSLLIKGALGTNAVCTNGKDGCNALNSPLTNSTDEAWHYSLGHWVEDDPVVGDGAFSSAGAFGFYPWIDSSKTYYGVVARQVPGQGTGDAEGFKSAECGRLIRQAWMTGVTVTSTQPTPAR